jgi:hypothetical protein
MERSLIWIQGDANGWPARITGKEARGAYDRLAAAKFREHKREAEPSVSATKQEIKRNTDTTFEERVRVLIKRGYRPRVAVDLLLQEVAIAHGNDPRCMEMAHADAEDFFLRIRKGLI